MLLSRPIPLHFGDWSYTIDVEIPILAALGVIAGTIIVSIIFSLLLPPHEEPEKSDAVNK